MSWLEGTIEVFKGDNPKHRELRKIKTSPGQDWNDQHFFHVSLARRAGYPDSALAAGCRIRFEPEDSDPGRPRVKSFPPYEAPRAASPGRTFLNPYHFIGLCAPEPESLRDAGAYMSEEPLHDRFAPAAGSAETLGEVRYSGRLLCRLTTEGPVVVGSTQRKPTGDDRETEVVPFELGDPEGPSDPGRRRPAVPGSSLRGLLSSLVEAASCSALRVPANRSFTRRADLGAESLSAVGRLEEHGGELRLRPLTLSLQEMTELSTSTKKPPKERCRVFLGLYERRGGKMVPCTGTFLAGSPVSHSASHQEFWYLDLEKTHWHGGKGLELGLVAEEDPIPEARWNALEPEERKRYTRGVLLVLGLDGSKPGNLPPTKKYEQFLPFPPLESGADPATATVEIPPAVLKELRDLLADSADLPRGGDSDDLPYLHEGRRRLDHHPKPQAGDLVYFENDPDTKNPRHLAYTAVWRRPVMGGTLYESVSLVSQDLVPLHQGRERLTLAERLFGFVEADGPRALASRVRFAHALAEGPAPTGGWYQAPTTLKILASPKPPSPALYFGNHGYLAKRELDLARHAPQGRKAYLHHRVEDVEARCYETSQPEDQRKLKMRVKPLKEGVAHLFHLDFTNVTAEELGFLLYAVRPTERFRHKLGMGKPLGLGTVAIEPVALAFLDREAMYSEAGLFGPKYASVEALGDPPEWEGSPDFLAWRYRLERQALEQAAGRRDPFPSARELREKVRGSIPEDIRWQLELLGDPAQVSAEVTYPVVAGQTTEGEHFRWFVENDKNQHKALPAIGLGGGLPALERFEPSGRGPKVGPRRK